MCVNVGMQLSCITNTANMHLQTQQSSGYELCCQYNHQTDNRIAIEERNYRIYNVNGHCLALAYYTMFVVLTEAPAWRSFFTTPEWPLEDAIISAVSSPCEEVEGGYLIS